MELVGYEKLGVDILERYLERCYQYSGTYIYFFLQKRRWYIFALLRFDCVCTLLFRGHLGMGVYLSMDDDLYLHRLIEQVNTFRLLFQDQSAI